jgi:hypothetical protein
MREFGEFGEISERRQAKNIFLKIFTKKFGKSKMFIVSLHQILRNEMRSARE